MKNEMEAYLDIETTSLSPADGIITVIGIYITDGVIEEVFQLVGENITKENIKKILKDVKTIYTYNGAKFDLPFIAALKEIDLTKDFKHVDLMHHCWSKNLYGGLKKIEKTLGIPRKLTEVDGKVAIELWFNYKNYNDEFALATLLEYNKEDVVNLKKLRQILEKKC